MLEKKDVREGDKLSWEGSCGTKTGFVVKEEDGMTVYTTDAHSFKLEDIISSPSLKKTGTIKIK